MSSPRPVAPPTLELPRFTAHPDLAKALPSTPASDMTNKTHPDPLSYEYLYINVSDITSFLFVL